MKKTIALVSALAVVFCCSFPVFAVTAPGKTITTSYNYGDVSVNVSVNAMPTDTQVVGTSHYEHRFTVTLTNKTNTFQVASTNMFGLKLYTGNNFTFDSTGTDSSGNVYNLGSWGSEVTSYSDNMTVPTVQFYNSNSDTFKGCVFIKFYDTDVLVLNPNETRTYDFTIDFTCYLPASAVPFNGDIQFSYFTYNGNISIYNKPASFTSNTIEQFINNDSLPNSAIAWLIASYEQGVVDQELYNTIIDRLTWIDVNKNLYDGVSQAIYYKHSYFALDKSPMAFRPEVTIFNPVLIDQDTDLKEINSTIDFNYVDDALYCVPVYVTIRTYNLGNYSFDLNNTIYTVAYTNSLNLSNAYKVGYTYDVVSSNGIEIYNLDNNNLYLISDTVPIHYDISEIKYITVRFNYYYTVNRYGSSNQPHYISGDYTLNADTQSWGITNDNLNSDSLVSRTLAKIRDKIQSILDSYDSNSSAAEDVSDSAESSSNAIDNQHQTESNYFSDSQSAIQDTGIQNFQFNPQELSGLNGLKDDFTAVWVSCGTLSRVWITSLTIGLALAIIRHRRMFQK